jgi:hypothetical protein
MLFAGIAEAAIFMIGLPLVTGTTQALMVAFSPEQRIVRIPHGRDVIEYGCFHRNAAMKVERVRAQAIAKQVRMSVLLPAPVVASLTCIRSSCF